MGKATYFIGASPVAERLPLEESLSIDIANHYTLRHSVKMQEIKSEGVMAGFIYIFAPELKQALTLVDKARGELQALYNHYLRTGKYKPM